MTKESVREKSSKMSKILGNPRSMSPDGYTRWTLNRSRGREKAIVLNTSGNVYYYIEHSVSLEEFLNAIDPDLKEEIVYNLDLFI